MDINIPQGLDETVEEAVIALNQLNIRTNSSEGGGSPQHGAPDFSYIEAKLSEDNLKICKDHNFLLNKVYSRFGEDDFLFNGSALSYGERTGYYIIGLKRENLSNEEIKNRFRSLVYSLQDQSCTI